jgi:methanogen extracellular protein (TIGR04279 family)
MTIEHGKTTHSIYTSSPFECVEYSFAGSTIYYYKEDKLWNININFTQLFSISLITEARNSRQLQKIKIAEKTFTL